MWLELSSAAAVRLAWQCSCDVCLVCLGNAGGRKLLSHSASPNQPTDWLSTTMGILCTLKIMRALERAYLDELGALYY